MLICYRAYICNRKCHILIEYNTWRRVQIKSYEYSFVRDAIFDVMSILETHDWGWKYSGFDMFYKIVIEVLFVVLILIWKYVLWEILKFSHGFNKLFWVLIYRFRARTIWILSGLKLVILLYYIIIPNFN